VKLRIVEPLPKLRRRRPDAGLEARVWCELYDEHDCDEDRADYAAQGSPTWLAALLVISAFLFGGLAFALVERWLRS
jgi:hypothetical protein